MHHYIFYHGYDVILEYFIWTIQYLEIIYQSTTTSLPVHSCKHESCWMNHCKIKLCTKHEFLSNSTILDSLKVAIVWTICACIFTIHSRTLKTDSQSVNGPKNANFWQTRNFGSVRHCRVFSVKQFTRSFYDIFS